MQTSKETLNILRFPGTQWATSLTSEQHTTLPNVKIIIMDFLPVPNSLFDGSYFGKDLPRVFPNLEKLLSGKGYIPWRYAPELFNSNQLTNLQFGVEVEKERSIFSVSFLRRKFPQLRTAVIRLRFPSCNFGGNKPELRGLETVRNRLSSLTVKSNCQMLTPTVVAGNRNQSKREESHQSANGEFILTFKLIKNINSNH